MSYFDGWTTEAIAACSDDECNRIIDLACAQTGIPLYLDEIQEPKCVVEPDWTLYDVKGELFEDAGVAADIAKWITDAKRWRRQYHWSSGYREREMERDESVIEVKPVKCFRPETHHKYQADIQAHEQRRTAYEQARDAQKKAYERRANIAAEVWKEIWDAKEKVEQNDSLRRRFVRYVDLAGGDKAVAAKFLREAEKLDERWEVPASWGIA